VDIIDLEVYIMEKRTNYGKIIAITLAVVAAFTAIAYVVYKFYIKALSKAYELEEDCDDLFLEEDDNCECECVQCEAADAE
jgi:hypothetical protein